MLKIFRFERFKIFWNFLEMPAYFCAKDLEDGGVGELVNGVDVGVAGEPQRHLIPPRTYHLATS